MGASRPWSFSLTILVYNNTIKKDIGILPFFTNYGFKTKPIYTIRDVKVVIEKIVVQIYQFKKLYKQLLEDIIFLKVRIA